MHSLRTVLALTAISMMYDTPIVVRRDLPAMPPPTPPSPPTPMPPATKWRPPSLATERDIERLAAATAKRERKNAKRLRDRR